MARKAELSTWAERFRSDRIEDGRGFVEWLLLVLSSEKVVQHCLVTWAFVTDRFGLRADMAVDYRWLVAIGGGSAVLFALACIGLVSRRRWSLTLLTLLALVDIFGEFVAQGTIWIVVTVSFVVAIAVLVLARLLRRRWISSQTGVG